MRFGHIGEQVFALAVTDLIQELYPLLRVGPASVGLASSFSSQSLTITVQKMRDYIKRKESLAEM
jgi:hypothetical protein